MTVFRFTWLFCIRLLIYCTLVLGQDMQNKPNGSLCALSRSRSQAEISNLLQRRLDSYPAVLYR